MIGTPHLSSTDICHISVSLICIQEQINYCWTPLFTDSLLADPVYSWFIKCDPLRHLWPCASRIRIFFSNFHGHICVFFIIFIFAGIFTVYHRIFFDIFFPLHESLTAGNLSPFFPLKQCPTIRGIFQERAPP